MANEQVQEIILFGVTVTSHKVLRGSSPQSNKNLSFNERAMLEAILRWSKENESITGNPHSWSNERIEKMLRDYRKHPLRLMEFFILNGFDFKYKEEEVTGAWKYL